MANLNKSRATAAATLRAPPTATTSALWTHDEVAILVPVYMDLSAEKRSNPNGKMTPRFRPDGSKHTQGSYLASVRQLMDIASGTTRGKVDAKMQNITDVLREIGATEFICPGFAGFPSKSGESSHAQKDRREVEADAMFRKVIQGEVNKRRALRLIAAA